MNKNRKEYCDHCGHEVIICGKCGNNTCNGGHGTIGYIQCDQCASAYEEYQKLKFVDFASSLDEDKDYKIGTQEAYEEFVKRRNGDSYAYGIALAGESLPDWKFRSNGSGVHTVTDAELEEYARIVAYKVANNLKRGYEMDPAMDPLRYE